MHIGLIVAWIISGLWLLSQFPLTEKFGMPGTFIVLVIWLVGFPLGIYRIFKGPMTDIRF